jgi:hypothetical protein
MSGTQITNASELWSNFVYKVKKGNSIYTVRYTGREGNTLNFHNTLYRKVANGVTYISYSFLNNYSFDSDIITVKVNDDDKIIDGSVITSTGIMPGLSKTNKTNTGGSKKSKKQRKSKTTKKRKSRRRG